jgi:hypothetical protein
MVNVLICLIFLIGIGIGVVDALVWFHRRAEKDKKSTTQIVKNEKESTPHPKNACPLFEDGEFCKFEKAYGFCCEKPCLILLKRQV